MVIFLYGEDQFRSNRKLAEIKNKFFEKNGPDAQSGLFEFAEKDYPIDEILMSISSGGLFSSKKLVIVKNYILAKKEKFDEKLEKFLKNEGKNPKRDLILVFWEVGKVKKSEKGYKLLQKIAKCQEFEKFEGAKLKNWIVGEVKLIGEEKATISPQAVDRLMVFVGNDLHLLSREIEKLVNYKNSGEISAEDVELLVKSKIDTDIFQTVDALARADKKTALRLLHNHLEAGEDPFYLLSMYFYQFRNLVKVKPLAEKNMPPQEIAGKLKMHPFVARKSSDQARNFSWTKLKRLYQTLCEVDYASKIGKTDIELALDKFVAEV
ncbi:MAG: DNA polymerase III subunit delta [Candidatus Moranbacteria bacterium]|nr:DNA polymerase III subunit delta [Candidatus Moranbacteria bacterium]